MARTRNDRRILFPRFGGSLSTTEWERWGVIGAQMSFVGVGEGAISGRNRETS